MTDVVREWWAIVLLICSSTGLGGFVAWIISTRTAWFKGNTIRAEEEAKQEKMKAQAFAAATIEAIKAGDASAYGTMLKWMESQLVEQSSQHQAIRGMLETRIEFLQKDADDDREEMSALTERVADLTGRDQQCQREVNELRVMVTQQQMTHREEQGVTNRLNDKLMREVKLLRKWVFQHGGDPTQTIVEE